MLNNPTNFIDPLGLCPKGTHPATEVEAQKILTAAKSFLNQPIKFGQLVPGPDGRQVACDWTGLLYLAIKTAGYDVPRTSTGQIHEGTGSGQYFQPDPNPGGTVGDVLLTNAPGGHTTLGHAVLVTSTDPLSFMGSQRSTGPDQVKPGGKSYNDWMDAFNSDHAFFQICVPDGQSKHNSVGPGGGPSGGKGTSTLGSLSNALYEFLMWMFSITVPKRVPM